ncbi:hypothetical protein [Haloferax sp. YSSS75]|uniref:hypothetical protein n=1 Tax=Haloferax sp. YSSS75 TaxID=3388564 RepID=UPI00398CA561
MVSPRRPLFATLGLLCVLAFAGVASAQNVDTARQLSPALRASVGFVVDVVVGGILVAALPSYTRDALDRIWRKPGESFLWGLLVGIGGLIALVVLALTVIGLLVAIPGFFAFILLAVVGGALATVFIGHSLVGRFGSGSPPLGVSLVVGALVAAVLSVVPLVGGLVLFVVDTLGLGILGKDLYETVS